MASGLAAPADWRTLQLPDYKGQPGWEFTSLRGFDLAAFEAAEGGSTEALDDVERVFDELGEGTLRLDQVDAAPVSTGFEAAGGALVLPLTQALERHPDLVRPHLDSLVGVDGDPFTARTAAEWTGGAFVYVPAGVRLEAPVLLTALQAQAGTALAWRVLVVLEENAQAEVYEQALSADAEQEALLTTTVELHVGPGARLRYVTAQDLSERTWLFGTQRASVERDAALDWVTLGFGGGTGRLVQNTILTGRGAEGTVTGAYASHNRQHLEFDTTQEHAAPDTRSDLAFRGILTDRSSSVWRGMIKVEPAAQRTDAFQESRNLLLSKRAHADAIPGLEILANDVRCTHAAAVAQIDPEQVFYLRSHGLDEAAAKRMVVEGFLAQLVERFEEGPTRTALAGALERRLSAVLGT